MRRISRLWLGLAVALGLGLALPAIASAHERRELGDGRYSVVIGFKLEPAYTGFLNGLDLRVTDNTLPTPAEEGGEPTGAPVEGLELTLQAEIIYGDQRMPLTLEPRWRTPGAYDAPVVPMAAGDYTFRIFGTISDLAVDESFTSSPETFSSVTDQAEIQFPKPAESAASAAPVIGTVAGGAPGAGIGAAAAIAAAAGAAGLLLMQRRRSGAQAPATMERVAGV